MECLTSEAAVELESSSCVFRHMFLLPHLLALDAMSQVKSPQTSHSNPFISELAMEEFGSPFESEACPLLQSLVARQEVNMMLFQLGHLSIPC